MFRNGGFDMRRIVPILAIILCIAILAMPVAAAKDPGPANAGAAGNPDGNQGQPQGTKDAFGPARETIQEENRIENQTGIGAGIQVQNRTETRLGNQTGIGTGIPVPPGIGAGVQIQNRTTLQLENQTGIPPGQNVSQLREMIRQSRQEMNATLQKISPPGQERNANQNEVRLAVHTLLAMENITGGIGPQVSAIARDFNNSAQSTWQLEERIWNRDMFSRFFFGGDQAAASELLNLTLQNENRIRQIEQLMNSGALDAETRAMLEEQLRIMEQESTRLNRIASAEEQDRGIFGWFAR
jgi:hypothetical protein